MYLGTISLIIFIVIFIYIFYRIGGLANAKIVSTILGDLESRIQDLEDKIGDRDDDENTTFED